MKTPTCEDIYNNENDFISVQRESDDSWRHGSYIYEVFRHVDEGNVTHWAANYRLSSDGETNELREGDANITQVWPYEVTTTEYRTTKGVSDE